MTDPKQAVKDYYYILGCAPEATQEQIAAAYQEMYDKFGPHVTVKGQDADAHVKAYKDIVEAWEVLSDPAAKAEYDRTHLPLLQKSHLRQLWGKLTGTAGEDAPKTRDAAPDTRVPIEVTLKEAIKGGKKSIRIEEAFPCTQCQGKKPVDRAKCFGCKGAGIVRNERPQEFDLPPGLHPGKEVRFPGRGKYDQRVQRQGDLVFEISIQPHPFFNLQGNDLCCTVPVNIYEAVLGAEIEIPTATGKGFLKITPLTQRGKTFRLKGFGLNGGDLLITIDVIPPAQLSADEVILFRKLKECSTQPNPRAAIFQKLAAPPSQ